MAPYKEARRPPSTGSAARHLHRPRQNRRSGGTNHRHSIPSTGSPHEMPSDSYSSSPMASQHQRRTAVGDRHIDKRIRSVVSYNGVVCAGSITSHMGIEIDEDPVFSDEPDEVVMALEMKTNGVVGCAYFVAATATLYLHEDTRITGFELIESLLFQAQPSSVIVPSRAPENFIDNLERQSRGLNSNHAGDENQDHGFLFRTTVSSNFSADAGKQALSCHGNSSACQPHAAHFTAALEDAKSYGVPGEFEELAVSASERNKLMQLGTSINLNNRVSLGCAGALVRDLERRRATSAASDAEHLKIRSIQTVTYKNCMFVTADTLLALQVFHPGLRQGFGRGGCADKDARMSQERKSIFDLFFDLAHTSQGRVKLREIFVRPSTDISLVNARHDAIACLMDPVNLTTVAAIRTALKRIRNIRPLLLQLRIGLFLPGKFAAIKQSAWSDLHDFCLNALHISSTGTEALQGSCDAIITALGMIDSGAIMGIKENLARYIDVQESKSSGRSTVASGVSDNLDSLKSGYGSLQARLGDMCENYRNRLPAESQDEIVGCIFHPQMGYLLVASAALQARLNNPSGVTTLVRASGFDTWEEVLQEDGLGYYKTEELGGIDTEFGDLAGQIIELEAEIFHGLGSAVLEEEEALLRASDAIGTIDCIFALAAGAEAFHLSRPRMTSCNVLHIKQGRHLLQDLGSGRFVPNNCCLSGGTGVVLGERDDDDVEIQDLEYGFPSAIVVTGPNQSGKSVYLKQAATILYLAHIGSYVPAEEAVVGITDKILTRIATRESVSRDESAFGVDLRQAAFAINFATRRSLILVDEFGKGTTTADGAALFEALISHFINPERREVPKVLAATHFHEIFDSGRFEKHPGLGLFHMSVSIDSNAPQPAEKVKFLHTLREGRSTGSFGCNCAAMNGVVSSVVDRASQITTLLTQGASLEKICLRSPDGVIGGLQEKEDRVRLFLAGMAEALDSPSSDKSPRSLLRLVFDEKQTSNISASGCS